MTGAGNINSGGTSFIGGTNLGGSGITGTGPTSIDALGGGLSLGVVKGTVDVLGNKVINLGVLARAMRISTPISCRKSVRIGMARYSRPAFQSSPIDT
ncbi:hypothetical protein G6F57_020587 [Rhizopus arrhizus]|nr:hypothetical protein G6F57_020587 [Rhizopus arrhizus]